MFTEITIIITQGNYCFFLYRLLKLHHAAPTSKIPNHAEIFTLFYYQYISLIIHNAIYWFGKEQDTPKHMSTYKLEKIFFLYHIGTKISLGTHGVCDSQDPAIGLPQKGFLT